MFLKPENSHQNITLNENLLSIVSDMCLNVNLNDKVKEEEEKNNHQQQHHHHHKEMCESDL